MHDLDDIQSSVAAVLRSINACPHTTEEKKQRCDPGVRLKDLHVQIKRAKRSEEALKKSHDGKVSVWQDALNMRGRLPLRLSWGGDGGREGEAEQHEQEITAKQKESPPL